MLKCITSFVFLFFVSIVEDIQSIRLILHTAKLFEEIFHSSVD